MADSVDVLVVGAGVIGLTTAVCLAEAGRRVRIRTAEQPRQTTSYAAGAMCGPSAVARESAWIAASVTEFGGLAGDASTGVRLTRGIGATRMDMGGPPPWISDFTELNPCTQEEMPTGFAMGFWWTVPMIDMPVYLDYLLSRFAAAGGDVELGKVDSLADMDGVVVNCTGVGARALAGDETVRPIRGQHVVVENPGIDTFFFEAAMGPTWASWMPHGNQVVLGGVSIEDDWSRDPDPEVAEQIVARCAAVEPRFADATVIEHRVGLRPGRPSVRLEEERVGGARIIHNYGHAGMGVSLSWGCAREVVGLLSPPAPSASSVLSPGPE